MRKYLIFSILCSLSLVSVAQTTVRLKVNHMLGDEAFSLGKEAKNDLDNSFTVGRLQYYISNISIIHDEGKETKAAGVYILANGKNAFNEVLGEFSDITKVEAINFSVGVDPFVNNEDPAQWPSSHPLAPKSPSMHWGWQAGYRFVAFEGSAGDKLNKVFQFHALGNNLYFDISIPTAAEDDNGEMVITLNADYTKAISGIDVSKGIIIHDDKNEAAYLMRNFQLKVFSSTSGATNTLSAPSIKTSEVTLYPNPSTVNSSVTLNAEDFIGGTLTVRNTIGQAVSMIDVSSSQVNLILEKSGVYFIDVTKGGLRSVKRLVIN